VLLHVLDGAFTEDQLRSKARNERCALL
jgi:hypothetical protein